jgi:hypothetical protein
MGLIKQTVKAITPGPVRRLRHRYQQRKAESWYRRSSSNTEVFSRVYAENHWGSEHDNDADAAFFSGAGSRDEALVGPYVNAVVGFLDALPQRPDAVDLGCGDFHVGAQIRPHCRGYVAGDVVPDLIAHNRERHAAADVDFRFIDIVKDALPEGDVVFIRQVLQHLSNADVAAVVDKLGQFTYAIITEHWPAGEFTPNLDIHSGPSIRFARHSGVVLEAPPFSLRALEQTRLLEVPCAENERIVTTAYRLR